MICGKGTGLYWDDLDEDISVPALLFGVGDRTRKIGIVGNRQNVLGTRPEGGGTHMEQIGTALQVARSFADAVLLKPLGELGGILSDTIGYWRLKNQVRLMVKAKGWLEQKKVDPAKVLPDIFVPILDEGSKVEDEQLSGMFASLLASHLDSRTQDRVHPSFPKVLSQLSPLDARAMVEFRKLASDREYRSLGLRGGVLIVKTVAELLGISGNPGIPQYAQPPSTRGHPARWLQAASQAPDADFLRGHCCPSRVPHQRIRNRLLRCLSPLRG